RQKNQRHKNANQTKTQHPLFHPFHVDFFSPCFMEFFFQNLFKNKSITIFIVFIIEIQKIEHNRAK
ncbi:MAG: hypothetical protein KJ808_01235, partial [Acidobacteria bacterium]|nr:hypothetical protein [Acidobacteriota bacterium]